jgi:hypothetical protein
MRKNGAITAALSVFLFGCSHSQQVVNITSIPEIQADLKREVGVYIAVIAEHEAQYQKVGDQTPYWCGNGSLDFMISSVKLDVATSTDISNAASGSASLPIGNPQPSVSYSTDLSNTQELTFTEYPWNPAAQDPLVLQIPHQPADIAAAPIAATLLSLRNGLMAATKKNDPNAVQACFSDVPIELLKPETDPSKLSAAGDGNTFKIGIAFTEQESGGLKIALGPLTLGDTLTNKDVASNSITVSFKPVHWVKQTADAASVRVAQLMTVAADVKPQGFPSDANPKQNVPDACKSNDPPKSCYPNGPVHSMDTPAVMQPQGHGHGHEKQKKNDNSPH